MNARCILIVTLLCTTVLIDGCHDSEIEETVVEKQTDIMINGEAGFPLSQFPSVKTISAREMEKLSEETAPETGVFIVDSDRVPYGFDDELKAEGLTLQQDGSLINKDGNKIVMFVYTRTYQLKAVEKVTPQARTAQSWMIGPTDFTESLYFEVERDGLLCKKKVVAKTKAYAWGKLVGSISGGLVPYSIDKIRTSVSTKGRTDADQCSNCSSLESRVTYGIGCAIKHKSTSEHTMFWSHDGEIVERDFSGKLDYLHL